MKTRPILFSAPMVRALLDGTKTQTRREVKWSGFGSSGDATGWPLRYSEKTGTDERAPCRFGIPGDRLWVREAWRVGKAHDARSPLEVVDVIGDRPDAMNPHGVGVTVIYEAGGWRSVAPPGRTDDPIYFDDEPVPEWAGKLRPSIHIPRAFSRITLELTDVRVERLQDISEADAKAEGMPESFTEQWGPHEHHQWRGYANNFRRVWRDLNGGDSWAANPFVWCLSFKRVEA